MTSLTASNLKARAVKMSPCLVKIVTPGQPAYHQEGVAVEGGVVEWSDGEDAGGDVGPCRRSPCSTGSKERAPASIHFILE